MYIIEAPPLPAGASDLEKSSAATFHVVEQTHVSESTPPFAHIVRQVALGALINKDEILDEEDAEIIIEWAESGEDRREYADQYQRVTAIPSSVDVHLGRLIIPGEAAMHLRKRAARLITQAAQGYVTGEAMSRERMHIAQCSNVISQAVWFDKEGNAVFHGPHDELIPDVQNLRAHDILDVPVRGATHSRRFVRFSREDNGDPVVDSFSELYVYGTVNGGGNLVP